MFLEIRPSQSLFGTVNGADVQEVKFNIEHLAFRATNNRVIHSVGKEQRLICQTHSN